MPAGWWLCTRACRRHAYRFDDTVGAVGQTGDVDLGLQLAVNRREETLGTVDAHHRLLADLHTDAALKLIHRDLRYTTEYYYLYHNSLRYSPKIFRHKHHIFHKIHKLPAQPNPTLSRTL